MDIQIKLLLEQLDNLKNHVKKLESRIEELENINSDNYCHFCKYTFHKKILKCHNCEKNICDSCVIKFNGKYLCNRNCCFKLENI